MEQICDVSISINSLAVQSHPFDCFLNYRLSTRNAKVKQSTMVSNGMQLVWNKKCFEKMTLCCTMKDLFKHFISLRIVQVTAQRPLNMGEIKVCFIHTTFFFLTIFFVD